MDPKRSTAKPPHKAGKLVTDHEPSRSGQGEVAPRASPSKPGKTSFFSVLTVTPVGRKPAIIKQTRPAPPACTNVWDLTREHERRGPVELGVLMRSADPLRTATSSAAGVRPLDRTITRYWRGRWWRLAGRHWVRQKWVICGKVGEQCRNTMPTRVAECPTHRVEVGTKQAMVENPVTKRCFEQTPELINIAARRQIPKGLAITMELILAENECQDCCYQMALLEQCQNEKEANILSGLTWGISNQETMVHQAIAFSKRSGRPVVVSEISPDGLDVYFEVDESSRSSNAKPVQILLVHIGVVGGSWMRHAVPWAHDLELWQTRKYVTMAKRCADELGAKALEELLQSIQTQPAAPIDEKAATPTLTPTTREFACQTDHPSEWFPLTHEDCTHRLHGNETAVQVSALSKFTRFRWTPSADVGDLFDYCDSDGWGENHLKPVSRYHEISEGYATLGFVADKLSRPDIAVASINNIRKYGQRSLYVFAEKSGRCVFKNKADYMLSRKDVVKNSNGRVWKFEECFTENANSLRIFRTYRLVFDTNDLAGMKLTEALMIDWMPSVFYNPLSDAVVLEEYTEMPSSIANNLRWRLEHMTETDPGVASLLAYARGKAASGEDLPAARTAKSIRTEARSYRGALVGFNGRFSWGFCYGCGSESRGKYEMRLCKFCQSGGMSPLGRAVADGQEVATHSSPIHYPNFVTRDKAHPELKANVETTESDENGPYLGGRVRVYSEKRKTQLRYDQIQGMVKPGKGPYGAGVLLDGASPFVTQAGTQPLVEAILFRVFKKLVFADGSPRTVEPRAFKKATELAESELLLGKFLRSSPTVMKIIDYILSNPNPRRRKQLLEAWRLWDERGEHSPDWDEIQAFVKQENLPWFAPKNGVLNPTAVRYIARLIQAPSDESHLVAGRYLKPLVKELKSAWDKDNWIFYGSADPVTLDEWLQRIRGCESFFWSDYSAFDSTFSEHTWDMIEGFYRRIYPDAEEDFWEVMKFWRTPKGRIRVRADNTRVEYDAGVCNCSGRDDTSLANALFNGIALSMAFAAVLAKKRVFEVTEADLQKASTVCTISIMGDDSLVGCDFDVKPLEKEIVARLQEFGLIVKAESSRHLHDVTYLGMMPYFFKDGGVQWGPTIGRRLYKQYWMRELTAPAAWVRGVAEQASMWRNVPILYDLACRVQELLVGKSITRERKDEIRPWHYRESETKKWDAYTVHMLCMRYSGLTPEMIIEDLQTIRKIERLPAVVRLHSLEHILQKDDL